MGRDCGAKSMREIERFCVVCKDRSLIAPRHNREAQCNEVVVLGHSFEHLGMGPVAGPQQTLGMVRRKRVEVDRPITRQPSSDEGARFGHEGANGNRLAGMKNGCGGKACDG
jgi:hypothetical protein